MRAPVAVARLIVAAAVSVAATQAAAGPELGLQVGRSFGAKTQDQGVILLDKSGAQIASLQANRKPHGSFSVAASLLWPWEERFRFGVQAIASDLGSWVFLDQPGEPAAIANLGVGGLEVGHLAAWGGAWRMDALGPEAWRLGRSYASATYGYYRWVSDRHGRTFGAVSSVGGSLAVGLEHALGPHHSLGLALSATRVSGDVAERYFGASLEWRWRR